ncbi:DNA polymerase V subunit UmuC, partial [Pseudoalteromonas ruthenica]
APSALKAAMVTHCSIIAKKLRQQHSLTKRIIVIAHSSPHEDGFFKKSFIQSFPVASSDSTVLAKAVEQIFDSLFKPGVKYYKAGVGAIELEDDNFQQADMFNGSQDKPQLMKVMDQINKRYGTTAARLGSEVQSTGWTMKREYLSPRYTTRWADIPTIKC